jgi:uncharacterized protein (DUF885 family)
MLVNRRRDLFLVLVAALGLACQATPSAQTAQAPSPTSAGARSPLAAFYERYWEEQSRFDPLAATGQGDNRFNDLLPNDQTAEFRERLRAFYADSLRQVESFDRRALRDDEKVTCEIFIYEMKERLEGLKLPTWMMPTNQFEGLPLTLGQYGSGQGMQPFKTVKDYDDWLKRVHGFVAWSDSAIENFRAGMKAGVVLPKTLVVKMIPQVRAKDIVVSDPTASLFYGPIRSLPSSFTAEEKSRLTEAYKKAILTDIVPTYRTWGDFLENEYLPKAGSHSGVSALPGGAAVYAHDVSFWTTTSKTPDEIHAIGLSEVARLRTKMERVKTEAGFTGDLKSYFELLKTDPKSFPYRTEREVLDAYRQIQARIEPNLKKMFRRTPTTPFEIRQTEAFRAASASAEYVQGSPDGTRPGIFYVPILDPTKKSVSGSESLFLHEAIPGHHYQVSLQQENRALPKFRQFAWYGAMGEGWALYAESLGKELGLYTDPVQYIGALGAETHRAIRLVVDTGLHTGKMTRDEAIEYMVANESIPREFATSEIERYMAVPGQALSYKIGALKIEELRARYEERLGSAFSLADFHDELLRDGAMPLASLEAKMDAWAVRARATARPTVRP